MSDNILEPPKGKLQKVDVAALSTLIQQYDQALESSSEKIANCEKSKDDYLQLWKRLATLPNKLEYDAMLPLGTRALCPGKIIHTNEIVCRLGDNWYIETSAKTAAEIVAHRLKKCEEMLTSLIKEEELYKSWRAEANRQKTDAVRQETIEIHEEYDDDKEKQWRIKHKENLRKYHQNLGKERKQKAEEASKEDDIWSRLDELELEEELEQAGISLDSLVIDDVVKIKRVEAVETASVPKDNKKLNTPDSNDCLPVNTTNIRKKVTFSSENVVHNIKEGNPLVPYVHPNRRKAMSIESSPSTSNESSSSAVVQVIDPLLIHFKHSQPDETGGIESNPEECDNHSQKVRTPGDILKVFGKTGLGSPTGTPKSILKSHCQTWPNASELSTEDNMRYNHVATNQSSITGTSMNPVPTSSKPKKATVDTIMPSESLDSVKDTVIERRSGFSTRQNDEPLSDNTDAKPVSLFRQSMQKK